MFSSTVLEVGIGLAFVYFLLAAVCSAVNESIAGALRSRARHLEQGLLAMLREGSTVKALLQHPLVRGLGRGDATPSYLPASLFATALLDMVAPGKTAEERLASLRTELEGFPPHLRETLEAHLRQAGDDLAKLRRNLEDWFDMAMDRLSGWYKRRAQLVILLISATLVTALNIDSIAIAEAVTYNSSLRAAVVSAAGAIVAKDEPARDNPTRISALQTELSSMGVPIGWGRRPETTEALARSTASAVSLHVAGLAITIFAAALGAPFWFELLSKLVNLRSAGKVPPRARRKPTAPPAPTPG